MTTLEQALALKSRLPRTWSAFLEPHGNFTPTQLAAIPALLNGNNVILCAPPASGKTVAALAPLIEQHCTHHSSGLRLLYVIPTRALANDLVARVAAPLETLRLPLAVKTRDLTTFDPRHPASVLITTPESIDSLLTSQARVFANLRAVILDEIHLFDATPRGDHLRVLLNRLRVIRHYAANKGHAPDSTIQYAALSATVDDPAGVAVRYFPDAQVIQTEAKHTIQAEYLHLSPDSATGLQHYLKTFRERGWRKAIVFCNSRADVETFAAAVRQQSPFGDAVYVHYSNIEASRRREIEQQFAAAEAAICFATSTLELGIDIGSVDMVILIGPPGDRAAFTQRTGRGNRRNRNLRAACFYRTALEEVIFRILVDQEQFKSTYNGFHPSVAVQQIFSLIKQSPTGAVRLNTVSAVLKDVLPIEQVEAVSGHLQQLGYLQPGRPGEWRAGPELKQLIDQQASAKPDLSIYSNIDITPPRLEIRSQRTGRVVARVERQWMNQPTLTLEGRPVNIEWVDGEALWITPAPTAQESENLFYRSKRKHLSFSIARRIPAVLGLPPDTAPLIETAEGWWWFHCLGDVYGLMLFNLLRFQAAVEKTAVPGLCLRLEDRPLKPFIWTELQVTDYIREDFRRFETMLALGAFHRFLPADLRRQAVIEQVNIPRFIDTLGMMHYTAVYESATDDLFRLLAPD